MTPLHLSTIAGAHRQLSEGEQAGNFCHDYASTDAAHTTPFDFKYCKGMHVGYTYEMHWPISNLGECSNKVES